MNCFVKRLFQIVIIISFCLCISPSSHASSLFAGGDGSIDNPYRVKTIDQLNEVRNHLDKHFIQIADIDMTEATAEGGDYYDAGAGWLPIGSSSSPFTGSFNGNGFSITGLTIDALSTTQQVGLFGSSTGLILNITLLSVDIKASSTSLDVGSIVGVLSGDGIVKNCSATGAIQAIGTTYTSHVGGIAGYSTGASTKGRFLVECSSSVDVTANTTISSNYSYFYTGGVLGGHRGAALTMTNCNNSGSVNVQGSAAMYTGGISGCIEASGLYMESCHNNGFIEVSYKSVTSASPRYYTGGILGNIDMNYTNPNGTTVSVSNVYNNGNIYAKAAPTNSYNMVGGIIGYASNSTHNCVLFNSYNTGTISADGGAYFTDVGGICGENDDFPISNVYNIGAVSGKTSKDREPNVGSIVGYNAGLLSNAYWSATAAQSVNNTSRSSTSKIAIGNPTSTEVENVVSMSPALMKSTDFVDTLNANAGTAVMWRLDDEISNSGYPVFSSVSSTPEPPTDTPKYHINSINISDTNGTTLTEISTGLFLATISVTNLTDNNHDTLVCLASYTAEGQYQGLLWFQLESLPIGSTIKVTLPVDNTSGNISNLKAFCMASFADWTPFGNSTSFLP